MLRWLTLGFLILPLLGLFVSVTPFDLPAHPGLVRTVALTTAVPAAVAVLAGLMLLKGSTRLHTVLVPLVACIAVVLPFGAYPMIQALNQEYDTVAAQPVTARIADRQMVTTHSRSGTHHTYYLYLADWHGETTPPRVTVDQASFYRLSRAQTVTVWERPGYLGMRWIADISPATTTESD
jgi:hypothetical protein